MSSFLVFVSTIISSFLSWFTSITLYLITNPVIMVLFGINISLLIYSLVRNLVKQVYCYGEYKRNKRRLEKKYPWPPQ